MMYSKPNPVTLHCPAARHKHTHTPHTHAKAVLMLDKISLKVQFVMAVGRAVAFCRISNIGEK